MRRPTFALPLLLACLATGATGRLHPARPVLVAPATISVPFERFVLANGLTALVYTDHSVPSVSIGIRYRIGSKDEAPGETGFAHLFEHLMFQDTAHRHGDLLTAMEGLGAVDVNGSTTTDATAFFETVPTNALDRALWLESDRMGYLDGGITQQLLDAQRSVVLNEKRQGELRPDERARQRFLAGFYPAGHPYAHPTIGSARDIETATLTRVKQWFTDYYGAGNAVIVLSGDIDAATAKAKIARYFGAIRPGRPIDQALQWTPPLDRIRREVVHDRFAAPVLTRSWPIANDDPRTSTLLQLVARALAGSRSAWLDRLLAADDGIATAVSAEVTEAKLCSVLTITLVLRPGIAQDAARQALDAALARFLAEGPDPDRIRAVVAGSDTAILRSLESHAAMANWLIEGEVEHGDPVFFLKQRDWIARARPGDLRAIAAESLHRPYFETAMLPIDAPPAPIADVDRMQMPPLGPFDDRVAFPSVTRTMLANGMTLVVARRERAPVIDATLRFATGALAEGGYPAGTATAAFDLMLAGGRGQDAAALARAAARLGTDLNTITGPDHSAVAWSATRDRLDASVALVADMVRHPGYPQAAIDRMASAQAQERDAAARDPTGVAGIVMARLLWGEDDPRARFPAAGGAVASRDALMRFHDRAIVPNAATLFMIGDIDPLAAKAMAERHFGDWTSGAPDHTIQSAPAPAAAAPAKIVLIDVPGAEQSRVMVGGLSTPFDPADAAADALAADVLADDMSGRLRRDLREARGWTYGFGGGLNATPSGPRTFVVGGTVQTDRTAASLAAIRDDLVAFTTAHPITQTEFDEQQTNALRSLPLTFSGNAAFMAAMISAADHRLPVDYMKGHTDRLSTVTLDQARAAARRIVRVDAVHWVIVGDCKAIETGIRALGIAPVEVWDVAGRRLR